MSYCSEKKMTIPGVPRRYSAVQTAQTLLLAASVIYGWYVVGSQGPTSGHGGGIMWLGGFAGRATVGAVMAVVASRTGRPGLQAVGFTLAATAPTTFAYPLNVALLVFAVVHGVRWFRRH